MVPLLTGDTMNKPTIIATIAATALAAAPAAADLVTYRYEGTQHNTNFAVGAPVVAEFTLDLDTVGVGTPGDAEGYDRPIVDGFFSYNGIVFPFDTDGEFNSVSIITDYQGSNNQVYNRYQLRVSTDGVERGGIAYHDAVNLFIFDRDTPRDTVVGTGLDQPLDTVRGASNGGIDSIVWSMGAFNGSVFSTITSGDGGMSIVPVPEPASAMLMATGGLLALRRRRK